MNEKKDQASLEGTTCHCQHEGLSRRSFMEIAGGTMITTALTSPILSAMAAEENKESKNGGIVGFFKSVFGICRTPELDPEIWVLEGSSVKLQVSKVSELQNPYGAVYLDSKGLDTPVLIVRGEEDNYFAFSNRCTHAGRKLDPVPGKSVLRCCSVSHATFDYQGKVLDGPAKEAITAYRVELKEDELIVYLG